MVLNFAIYTRENGTGSTNSNILSVSNYNIIANVSRYKILHF